MNDITPGKWVADRRDVYTDAHIVGNVICQAPSEYMPSSVASWEANSRLIAAAPDLFEALCFAKSVILSREDWTETCERVIQGAINKAKGIEAKNGHS